MTREEFLEKCVKAIDRYHQKAVVKREIWDTRYDTRTTDEWYIGFMEWRAIEMLYDQYAEAPMIKVKFTFLKMKV